ncbi:hypothetical protein [Mariniplasma anaerobium]|uniref:Uncharacterized protein n=1 Tax=Mariniplasma anaerobium TaxID=2735436 RepID=A0A7U9TJZ2_9MOLU|nr:hypothetical protein [Mariniplasma anaerobium]BCR36746.1 hypothetical protein MPAN_016390 [Mariniplasma anaerobium]
MDKKDIIKKAVKSILRAEHLLSLDNSDFGDLDKIIEYKAIMTDENLKDFNISFGNDVTEKTRRLIVNITSKYELGLFQLERILSLLKKSFVTDIEIYYGVIIDKEIKEVKIEIFASKQK